MRTYRLCSRASVTRAFQTTPEGASHSEAAAATAQGKERR